MMESTAIFMREAGPGGGDRWRGRSVCERERRFIKTEAQLYNKLSLCEQLPARSLGRAGCAETTHSAGRGGFLRLAVNLPASEAIQ